MKNLLSLFIVLTLCATAQAQTRSQNIDVSVKDVVGSNKGFNGLPTLSILSSGVIDVDGNLVLKANTSGGLVFEGATKDAFETTLSVADPTADRTLVLPDDSGTFALNPLAGTLTFEGTTADAFETVLTATDPTADVSYILPVAADGSYSLVSSTLATNAPDVANSVTGASNAMVYEGATANGFETSITPTDPTADRTVTLPDASGTVHLSQASTSVSLTADNQAVTPGSATVIQLSSNDATATNRTFTLSATGAITGQIYVLIGPATNQCEIADTGIQVLSATWSPTTGDTLTLLFDGTNFCELARANN